MSWSVIGLEMNRLPQRRLCLGEQAHLETVQSEVVKEDGVFRLQRRRDLRDGRYVFLPECASIRTVSHFNSGCCDRP